MMHGENCSLVLKKRMTVGQKSNRNVLFCLLFHMRSHNLNKLNNFITLEWILNKKDWKSKIKKESLKRTHNRNCDGIPSKLSLTFHQTAFSYDIRYDDMCQTALIKFKVLLFQHTRHVRHFWSWCFSCFCAGLVCDLPALTLVGWRRGVIGQRLGSPADPLWSPCLFKLTSQSRLLPDGSIYLHCGSVFDSSVLHTFFLLFKRVWGSC